MTYAGGLELYAYIIVSAINEGITPICNNTQKESMHLDFQGMWAIQTIV